MNPAVAVRIRIAAPRTSLSLALALALGVLIEGALAGGFLGGSQMWRTWHESVGTLLILIPLTNLVVALASLRRQLEEASMLAARFALLVLVITAVVTGHTGGALLALHIPVALAMVGLVVRQAMLATLELGGRR